MNRTNPSLPGTSPARPARAASLACAVTLVLGLAACGDEPAGSGPAETASEGLVLHAPLGAVEAFDVFVWDFGLPSGGHFEVAVYDFTSGEPLGPLRRSGSLELPQWTPRPGVAERWPAQILWRAFAYDREGALLASAEASASRR